MITESPDGTIRYIDASGKQVALSIFDDSKKYAAASRRISEQADGNATNLKAVSEYNVYVSSVQRAIDAGEPQFNGKPIADAVSSLPPLPQMQVWPDDPVLPIHTANFPAGTLLTLQPAPNVLPTQGGLGPDNPNRTQSPLDPALAARLDGIDNKLAKLYGLLLTVPGVKVS